MLPPIQVCGSYFFTNSYLAAFLNADSDPGADQDPVADPDPSADPDQDLQKYGMTFKLCKRYLMKCLLWLTNINISTDNWVSATIFNLITGKY